MRAFAVTFACVLAFGAARAGEVRQINPFDLPETILAARNAQMQPAIEFTYRIESGSAAPATVTVDLAGDYCALIQDTQITTFDFALKRMLVLNDVSHEFTDTSLFALLSDRFLESEKRRQGMAKDGPDLFWMQAELRAIETSDTAPKLDRHADAGGTVHLAYGGSEIASYAPSKQALSKDEGRRLARCLRYFATLHPAIDDDIAASGYLPQRLSFALPPRLGKPQSVWTLQSALRVKAVYPSRAGEKPVPPAELAQSKPLADLLPTLRAAVAGTAPGKRTVEETRASVEKALAEGHPFRALLLAFEINQQFGSALDGCTGASACHTWQQIVDAARSDPRMAQMTAALEPPADQLEAAIKTLREMKRDDLGGTTLLDGMLAQHLHSAGHGDEALVLYAASLKTNPYIAVFYEAMGNCYRSPGNEHAALAWLLYDLGRALPGGPRAPEIVRITDSEAEFVKMYPEYF